MRRFLKAGFFLSLFLGLAMPTARAGVLDPIPILKNIPDSPPENKFSPAKQAHFFCPLFKNFYNENDRTAVETIMLESLGEGYAGMVAVGEVIRNREKLFMKGSEKVCLMPKQFSCWNDERKARAFLDKYHIYYFVAYTAWLASKSSVLTRGATDYHADTVYPYWAEAYRVSTRIGRHVFYVRRGIISA